MSEYDKEFVSNPKAFMQKYAVIPLDSILRGPNGKKVSTTKMSFRNSGAQISGNASAALFIEQDDSGFDAYWLSYELNKSKRAVLKTDAKYMFTANMNGCSFGYGSSAATGEVLVGHANAADVGTISEQGGATIVEAREQTAQAQAAMLRKKMNESSLRVINRSHYVLPEADAAIAADIYQHEATVFGLLEGNFFTGRRWKFYMQRRTVTYRGLYVLKDVVAI